jgi:branched-chain amino acid transport system ATP-binding protein
MADLALENVSASYGPVLALRNVSLHVRDGHCAAVLGANGAGKTTLMAAISGLVPHQGLVLMDGAEVTGAPEDIAHRGIAHVLEGRQVFTTLTVKENLLVGGFGADRRASKDRLSSLLDAFPVLKAKLNSYGGELSGGQQQMLAIARSLVSGPKVVLMDEPSLGLSPVAVEQLAEAIGRLRKDLGTTLLVAEQSIALALEIAAEFHVLQGGRISYSGPGDMSVLWHEVHSAYLGVGSAS